MKLKEFYYYHNYNQNNDKKVFPNFLIKFRNTFSFWYASTNECRYVMNDWTFYDHKTHIIVNTHGLSLNIL